MSDGRIVRITGSVIGVAGLANPRIYNRVEVGPEHLAGEIIRIRRELATVQIFEEAEGLKINDPVVDLGTPFEVELGPGLLGSVFDGILRPLDALRDAEGPFLGRGSHPGLLDSERSFEVELLVGPGDEVQPGMPVAVTSEGPLGAHRILCPQGVGGVVARVFGGKRNRGDSICELLDGRTIGLIQRWPCRLPRPHGGKLPLRTPAVTGQRVIDSFFPMAEGGLAIIPGGFGTGKTVLEQTIAKHMNADVLVYVGCGERGNEMTDILKDFLELNDPRTGHPLIARSVIIANTSNMPVAAREASLFTGITIAEYYRDMGLRVVLFADSMSRWGEALREISSRLEEAPGEEGFPSYLSSRLSRFYERAGIVKLQNSGGTGSLTVFATVSPPGGDLSEPITQASLRMAGCFWALDPLLAAERHFPAIDMERSFSLYRESTRQGWEDLGLPGWRELGDRFQELLASEKEIREIAHLVGYDAMQDPEKLTLQIGRAAREGFLRQDSYHKVDMFSSPRKTRLLLEIFLRAREEGERALAVEGGLRSLKFERLALLRYRTEAELESYGEGILKV